jgi:CheY-like chemotaxis protein
MEQSPLDLLPFIKELDKMLGRVMPETIRLELNYQPGVYLVNADPTRLQQVFVNLALNARDAMPEGGVLRFGISRIQLASDEAPPIPDLPAGEWIRVSVHDTGTGISPEILPHIFEPFFTTKPVGQGTGLGLAQVYGIIKQHDAYMDVRSEVGRGTTFNIYLPALDVKQEQALDSGTSEIIDGNGETVLLVEDDQTTLNALQALLEAQNYQVRTAKNGMDALKQYDAARGEIALVVSDVVMPKMGGVALYRALQERWPEIRMLFITGHPGWRNHPCWRRAASTGCKSRFRCELGQVWASNLPSGRSEASHTPMGRHTGTW